MSEMWGRPVRLFLTSEPPEVVRLALVEALDLVDFGMALLTPDLRVCFLNQRFQDLWALSPGSIEPDTTFRQLLRRACESGLFALAPDEAPDFLAAWEIMLRDGGVEPAPLDLSNGQRLLVRCVIKDDGSRILTCIDITPLRQEQQRQQEARDIAERLGVDLRFTNETLEAQAAYLATLAETADEAARRADRANLQLEREVTERRALEAKLRHMATTDPLTGALNRAEVLTLGQQELEQARIDGTNVAVLMLDIDHFKRINDGHGHAAGDAALRHLIGTVTKAVRRVDLIGRVGGEEFAVILPGIARPAAARAAARLRQQIADSEVEYGGGEPIRMTVSIGLALTRDDEHSIEQTLARADASLYAAKRGGRNRVVISEEESVADTP
jgi:diguanylate cyclase (GGDEF)-like protein